jgi:cytochrome c7-like protein
MSRKPTRSPDPPAAGPLFSRASTTIFRVAIAATAALAASAAYVIFQYYHSPYWSRVGLAPDQPVLFSHRHHAGDLRIDCRFCHATVETAAFAGMPTTETCLTCHSQIFTDAAMLQPVIRSATTGEPLRWTRVTRLPDHVYFNHGVHVAQGVACAVCHGELGKMALTAKAEPLDMRWCLDCHRDPAPRLAPSSDRLFAAFQRPAGVPVTLRQGTDASFAHLTNCSTCHH